MRSQKEMKRVMGIFERGRARVMTEEPERFERLSSAVKCTIDKEGDLNTAVADLLTLDNEWQQLSRETGLSGCSKPNQAIVVFLVGVIVGLVIAATIDEIND